MALRAFIFDIDGTLLDTNDQHVEAWRKAFASLGYDIPASRISTEIGKGADQLVPAVLGEGSDAATRQKFSRRHTELFQQEIAQHPVRLFAGVPELLQAVRSKGLLRVLATSSKHTELEKVEQNSGFVLHRLADALVTADEARHSKPAPDLVAAAVAQEHLRPDECVMIGDTPYDVQASLKAGVPGIGLLCGRQHSEEALRHSGAVAVYRDPADLLGHLEEAISAAERGRDPERSAAVS